MERRNPIIETVRYNAALELIRSGNPSAADVSLALGACDPNGMQGNIWSLLDARQAVARGDFTGLNEATWKALHGDHVPDTLDLLHGIFIDDEGKTTPLDADTVAAWQAAMRAIPTDPRTRPTGPRIDVNVLLPDGGMLRLRHDEYMERVRHPEGVKLVEGATYELPPGTVLPPEQVVQPGEPLSLEDPHHPDRTVFLRPVPILAVFYDDGIISFAGDATEFIKFRDMAAKVVDPSRRGA